jgi:hypothetical protein
MRTNGMVSMERTSEGHVGMRTNGMVSMERTTEGHVGASGTAVVRASLPWSSSGPEKEARPWPGEGETAAEDRVGPSVMHHWRLGRPPRDTDGQGPCQHHVEQRVCPNQTD